MILKENSDPSHHRGNYIHTHMYTCMCVCRVYADIYIHMYTQNTCLYMITYISIHNTCIDIHVYIQNVYIYTCVCTSLHRHMYIYVFTQYMQVYIYVYTQKICIHMYEMYLNNYTRALDFQIHWIMDLNTISLNCVYGVTNTWLLPSPLPCGCAQEKFGK